MKKLSQSTYVPKEQPKAKPVTSEKKKLSQSTYVEPKQNISLETLLANQLNPVDEMPAPPTARWLKHEAAAKKWSRVCNKIKQMLIIQRRLKEFEEYDKNLATQRKGIAMMKKRLNRQLELMVVPKDHLNQNQLVETYSEFVTVAVGSKHV